MSRGSAGFAAHDLVLDQGANSPYSYPVPSPPHTVPKFLPSIRDYSPISGYGDRRLGVSTSENVLSSPTQTGVLNRVLPGYDRYGTPLAHHYAPYDQPAQGLTEQQRASLQDLQSAATTLSTLQHLFQFNSPPTLDTGQPQGSPHLFPDYSSLLDSPLVGAQAESYETGPPPCPTYQRPRPIQKYIAPPSLSTRWRATPTSPTYYTPSYFDPYYQPTAASLLRDLCVPSQDNVEAEEYGGDHYSTAFPDPYSRGIDRSAYLEPRLYHRPQDLFSWTVDQSTSKRGVQQPPTSVTQQGVSAKRTPVTMPRRPLSRSSSSPSLVKVTPKVSFPFSKVPSEPEVWGDTRGMYGATMFSSSASPFHPILPAGIQTQFAGRSPITQLPTRFLPDPEAHGSPSNVSYQPTVVAEVNIKPGPPFRPGAPKPARDQHAAAQQRGAAPAPPKGATAEVPRKHRQKNADDSRQMTEKGRQLAPLRKKVDAPTREQRGAQGPGTKVQPDSTPLKPAAVSQVPQLPDSGDAEPSGKRETAPEHDHRSAAPRGLHHPPLGVPLTETRNINLARQRIAPLPKEQLVELLAWACIHHEDAAARVEDIVAISPSCRRFMVRNISFQATDAEFRNFMAQFGPLEDCIIVREADKTSRGFGFVTYARLQDAEQLLSGPTDRLVFRNRQLFLKLASDPFAEFADAADALSSFFSRGQSPSLGQLGPKSAGGSKDHDVAAAGGTQPGGAEEGGSGEVLGGMEETLFATAEPLCRREVFVRNLPLHTTEADLFNLFKDDGEVVHSRIVANEKLGTAFGFAAFTSYEAARKAVQQPQRNLQNRSVFVSFASKKGAASRRYRRMLPFYNRPPFPPQDPPQA